MGNRNPGGVTELLWGRGSPAAPQGESQSNDKTHSLCSLFSELCFAHKPKNYSLEDNISLFFCNSQILQLHSLKFLHTQIEWVLEMKGLCSSKAFIKFGPSQFPSEMDSKNYRR